LPPDDNPLSSLRDLDWDDLEDVSRRCQDLLRSLAVDRDELRRLVTGVGDREDLMGLCEHYDILDKVVLADDPNAGVRLRLHRFLPGHFDRPHNHRWTYVTRVLAGGYTHYLYGDDADLSDATDVAGLRPVLVRREEAGAGYALDHRMVHAAVADADTVTLVVRGPAMKERFLVMDRVENRSWWQYGAAAEAAEEQRAKRMTTRRLNETVADLAALGVI
jgi:hypothetical protein